MGKESLSFGKRIGPALTWISNTGRKFFLRKSGGGKRVRNLSFHPLNFPNLRPPPNFILYFFCSNSSRIIGGHRHRHYFHQIPADWKGLSSTWTDKKREYLEENIYINNRERIPCFYSFWDQRKKNAAVAVTKWLYGMLGEHRQKIHVLFFWLGSNE